MGAYARNAADRTRIYFEDEGGSGPPVIFTYGFMDSIPAARALPLARDLAGSCRLIFVDHRGHGKSDRPTVPEAYALPHRVADIVAVLDDLHIERAHYIGVSWGARLGFALAEHAPDRFYSFVLSANQPYAWDTTWPIIQAISGGVDAMRRGGMEAMLRWFEEYAGHTLQEHENSWLLDNDPEALSAAWQSALEEGVIAEDPSRWLTPMLIVAGQKDDMYENARRAAEEIPKARFLDLGAQTHLASVLASALIVPEIKSLWTEVGP